MMDVTIVILLIVIGLFLGMFPFLVVFREFVGAMFGARFGKNKVLIILHMKDGFSCRFVTGEIKDSRLIEYKFNKKDYSASVDDGSLKRVIGVFLCQIDFGETVPYSFKRLFPIQEKVMEEVEVEKYSPELKQTVKVKEMQEKIRTKFIQFLGWEDAEAMSVALRTALTQPRKGIGLGIDLKTVGIALLIIVVVAFAVWKLSNGGGSSGATI